MNMLQKKTEEFVLASPEELIEEARNGRMFILVDDEDRENEGDLIIPAQMVTPASINFMATHGRGLICLALEGSMVKRLNLPMMAQNNTSGHGTAFTVSIEAKEGVSTGISAPDRARTIQVAIDPNSNADDIAMPGHIFPLHAKDGGVLVRAGHTEAAVDIAKLAGLSGAGVICEVMKDDGTMARLDDLCEFAQNHDLKVGTIADLIAYRMRTEQCVEIVSQKQIESRFGGDFTLINLKNNLNNNDNFALVKGKPDYTKPVHVRVHAVNAEQDLLGVGADTLQKSMESISEIGEGVVLVMQPERVMDKPDTSTQTQEQILRHYGIGAQMLKKIGVQKMILLTSSHKHMVGLSGFGLDIVEQKMI